MSQRSVAISLTNVTKSFGLYRSNIARLLHWFGVPLGPSEKTETIRNVTFKLHSGESLALIGENGAGKSTLLKLITGTMAPTSGEIEVNQSVSAILELGLGFNMEFTGRQNVMHSAGMMGLAPSQIEALLPEIQEFAEIGDYFDRPLRTYSSGMQARLSFSLATALRPEILIVDEVLSVGDAYFQHKSFAKIREFRELGTTIILVTHSLGDVRELCDRVLLIDRGEVVRDGPPDEVIDYYNAMIAIKENARFAIEQTRRDGWVVSRSGTYDAVIGEIRLLTGESREAVNIVRVGEVVTLKIHATAHREIERLVLGIMIRDRTGHVVWGSNTWHTRQVLDRVRAQEEVSFRMSFTCSLGPGTYSISTALVSSDTHLQDNFEWIDNVLVFEVVNLEKPLFIGSSYIDAAFNIQRSGE